MKNKLKYFMFTYVIALALLTSISQANVSLKNGNYFIAFIDMIFPGGFETKIERVFNSKSSHNGWFGFGWGSDYEAYLTVSADGSIVMHENGGGAQNRFTPNGKVSDEDVKKAVEQIAAARQKEGMSPEQLTKYREQLRSDARFRNDEWERFWSKGVLQAKAAAVGTQYRSNRFSYQVIARTQTGYVRTFENGRVETFDAVGRLVKISDKNRNYINLSYGKDGKLAKIEDNYNRRLNFTFNGQGKVVKIQAEGGKTAVYEYGNHMLLKSTDSEGKTYRYKYTNDGRYNLAEIGHPNNTKIEIGYFPKEKGEGVKWVKDVDGTYTEYAYTGTPESLNYSTEVTIKGSDGKVLTKNKYEYTDKVKADGERYTYRLLTDVDGDKTETFYNECCGLPLRIIKNSEETTFEYDPKGRITKKSTPFEVTEITYDMKVNKISKVVKYSKKSGSKASQHWATYQYDERGNLVFAKNSENKGVRLVYDANGRIKAMIDQGKRRLEFVYNDQSRPVQIVDPSVGRIDVAYTNAGEIKNVSSTGGRKIAMQVTSAFQNLLEIIRPAGVTLNF